jgi:hypothetical protein
MKGSKSPGRVQKFNLDLPGINLLSEKTPCKLITEEDQAVISEINGELDGIQSMIQRVNFFVPSSK